MDVSYDPEKRRLTLEKRGLDFDDAADLFASLHYTRPDQRYDYGEDRYISVGLIGDDTVVVVWTQRDDNRRIISMRKADRDERHQYREWLDRS